MKFTRKKTIIKIVSLIAVIPISYIVVFTILHLSAGLYNNLKTDAFYTSLKNITLPAESKVVDGHKTFGLIWGNSNHCDVEIAIVVESKIDSHNFDIFLQNSSNSLEYPYKNTLDKKLYYELFVLREDNSLVFINDGKEYVIRKSENGGYYPVKDNNEREYEELYTFWENRDFDRMLSFSNTIKRKEGFNYFLIKTTDQTFNKFPMNDLRCH